MSDPLNMFSGRPASVSLLLWRYTDLKHSTQTVNTESKQNSNPVESTSGLLQSRLLAESVGVDFGELVSSKISADQRGREVSGSCGKLQTSLEDNVKTSWSLWQNEHYVVEWVIFMDC